MKLSNDEKKELESIFSELKNGIDKTKAIKFLELDLKKIFKKNFVVKVIPTKEKKYSFVMSVIPEKSVLDKVTKCLLNNDTKKDAISDLWKKCNNWTIEIDERILDSSLSDRELVALLLHEIGHIVDSDSVPTRIKTVVQYSIVSMPFDSKSLLKQNMFSKMLSIPVVNACLYGNTKTALRKELKADKFSMKNGYRSELLSAITKIEQRGLSNENLNSSTDYMNKALEMLSQRKSKLVKECYDNLAEKFPEESCLYEMVTEFTHDFIEPFKKNTYSDEWLYESVNNKINTIIDESYTTEFLNIGKKKLKPISQNEIDYVAMKAQDMESIDDKIMLMSYVNSKLDMINYYLGIMEVPELSKKYIIPNSEVQLNRYKTQLYQIKKYITNYKIPEEKVVVVYPDKYMG